MVGLFLVLCVGWFLWLTAGEGDGAPAAVASTPADPPKPPDGPKTIQVGGKTFTEEQILRHADQASEMGKLIQSGMGNVIKAVRDGRITVEHLQAAINPPPANPGEPDPAPAVIQPTTAGAKAPDVGEINWMIDQRVQEKLSAMEFKRGIQAEKKAVETALKRFGLTDDDADNPMNAAHINAVKAILNRGVKSKDGQVAIPPCVDEQGNVVPATPELVDKITEFYATALLPASEKLKNHKFGTPPPVPPGGTGTGPAAHIDKPGPKSLLYLSPQEAMAQAREHLARKHAAGQTASAVR